MTTAVYSGSFNPLHKGHLAILRRLATMFQRVYLVVSPQSPFKDESGILTARDRYNAAIEAVERYPELRGKVKVEDIELGMEPPHYTIRTLRALSQREPRNTFTLVVGADHLESITRWKEYQSILKDYGIMVFPRKGYHRGHLKARLMKEDPSYRIELLHAPNVNISSTEIRNAMASGEDMSKYLM